MKTLIENLIEKHIKPLHNDVRLSSVQHFVESGSVTGSFYASLEGLANDYHNTIEKSLFPKPTESIDEVKYATTNPKSGRWFYQESTGEFCYDVFMPTESGHRYFISLEEDELCERICLIGNRNIELESLIISPK